MNVKRPIGLVITAVLLTALAIWVPVWAEPSPQPSQDKKDPWATIPKARPKTNHAHLLPGPYKTPQEVTQACLQCHPNAANEVMQTTHWTWLDRPVKVPWREEPLAVGKRVSNNNFCIGVQGNWPKCTTCHIGYGWRDTSFDFDNPLNVDCLACHADPALYAKGEAGMPAKDVDLTAAAQSVGGPVTRMHCGKCHFNGGGGNGVKHGDLDESLYFPGEDLDVHMGRYNLLCVDCHKTERHQIKGHALSFALEVGNQVRCTDCHDQQPHADERLNNHVDAVACQACHVPATARKDPTKVFWDWSTAGQDLPNDHYTYLKIKGSFVYERNLKPEYYWWNGKVRYRYAWGDKIDPTKPVLINPPDGDIHDPNAKIWPFKVHRAKVPYDKQYNILLQPKLAGEGGFWTEFDWDKALRLGAEIIGVPYSGDYGFTEAWFFYPQTHMVPPKEQALQCNDCHGPDGRLDWQALGYPGDPAEWGGRQTLKP